MMTHNKGDNTERLATEVRRQFGAEAVTRFLRSLPAFRAEADTPDRFRELLERLDGAESSEVSWRRR